eukprot:2693349-Amphidinium_carterae.1
MVVLCATATSLLGCSEVEMLFAYLWMAQLCVFMVDHTSNVYNLDGVPVSLTSNEYMLANNPVGLVDN